MLKTKTNSQWKENSKPDENKQRQETENKFEGGKRKVEWVTLGKLLRR